MEWGRPTGPHRSLCLPKPGDTGKSILIMKVHPSLGQRARGSCFAVTVYAQKSKLALSEALGLEPCLAPRAPIARAISQLGVDSGEREGKGAGLDLK